MSDELIACWAALVALVDDIHAPQDNLTEAQWQAAERILDAFPPDPATVEDHMLQQALMVMVHDLDIIDYSVEQWAVAERMREEYTAKVEALP